MARLMGRGYSPAEKSVNWAENAVAEMGSEFKKFFGECDACPFIREVERETGDSVVKIKLPPLPPIAERRASEALLSAKNAFDQTLNAAIGIISPGRKGTTYFPWATDPDDLTSRLKAKGIPEQLWPAIKRQEPYYRSDAYTGGDDLMRILATIANQKHTIGLAVDVSAQVGLGAGHISGEIIFLNEGGYNPVTNEIELVRVPRDSTFDAEYGFALQIILDEARLPKSTQAFPALDQFAAQAHRFLDDIKGVCPN